MSSPAEPATAQALPAVLRTALALIRTLLALVFLYSGATKLLFWQASGTEVAALGLPSLTLPLTIAVQLGFGTLLLLGKQLMIAGTGLALFTLTATLLAHSGWLAGAENWRHELTVFLEHLAIVGGLLLIALVPSLLKRTP